MKVHLRFLAVPKLAAAVGAKETTIDFKGTTVKELIHHLLERYGASARRALLDEDGKLDLTIQLLLNEKEWIAHHQHDTRLNDGDTLIFMFLAAGG